MNSEINLLSGIEYVRAAGLYDPKMLGGNPRRGNIKGLMAVVLFDAINLPIH